MRRRFLLILVTAGLGLSVACAVRSTTTREDAPGTPDAREHKDVEVRPALPHFDHDHD